MAVRKYLIVTFATTTMALMMERACKRAGAPGRLIPLPKAIDAGCGMAWAAQPGDEDELTALMGRERIRAQRITRATL